MRWCKIQTIVVFYFEGMETEVDLDFHRKEEHIWFSYVALLLKNR